MRMSKQKRAIVFISLLLFGAVASFFWLDASVAQTRIDDHLPGDLSEFLQIVSKFGHGSGCLIALLAIAILDRANRRHLSLVLATPVLAGIVTTVLKVAVLRPRPFVVDEVVRQSISFQEALSQNALQSFPSGHTATAVGLALALSSIYPHGRILFAGLALATCVQRVVTQCHFPSDVFVGAVIGILSFYVARRVCDKLARRRQLEQSPGEKLQPEVAAANPDPASEHRPAAKHAGERSARALQRNGSCRR